MKFYIMVRRDREWTNKMSGKYSIKMVKSTIETDQAVKEDRECSWMRFVI